MSASNSFEAALLALILQNVDLAGLGDATGLRGSIVAGHVYVALHSSDPGEAGDQTTNELAYTGYGRVAVVRSVGTWTIAGTSPTTASNAATVTFGKCTAGAATATHFSVGFAASGASTIIVSAALNAPLAISAGIKPTFEPGDLAATVD